MLPLPPMLQVLCLFTRPEKRQAEQCLLSLLVHNRVFFFYWYARGSSFPAGVSSCLQISYLKILPWHRNKMANGHKTHTLGRQSSNDHHCQIWLTSLRVLWRKCNLTISPFKSIGPFSCHSNQIKRQITNISDIS